MSPKTRKLQEGIFHSYKTSGKINTQIAIDIAGTPSLNEIDDDKKEYNFSQEKYLEQSIINKIEHSNSGGNFGVGASVLLQDFLI